MDERAPVLIIDDDESVGAFLERLLTAAGYDACVARDQREASACVARRRPAFMLVDLVLGPDNGWKVARAIAPGVPFLIMSGAGVDAETRRDAQLLGAVAVVEKPFDAAQLVALVGSALGS